MPDKIEASELRLASGRSISLDRPLIMAILNVTPDSFYDGEKNRSLEKKLAKVKSLIESGAAILDIGGESTRPGAKPVGVEEEIKRVIPLLRAIKKSFPQAIISIDTMKAEVAEKALQFGADMINDVSAGEYSKNATLKLAISAKVPMVLMHKKGTPATMQENPHYEDVVEEVKRYLKKKADLFFTLGGVDNKIILDPGLGFGKTLDHNLCLLRRLKELGDLGFPILIGASRKRMLGELTGKPLEKRLAASLGVHLAAVLNGAKILRVHDSQEMADALNVFWLIKNPPK